MAVFRTPKTRPELVLHLALHAIVYGTVLALVLADARAHPGEPVVGIVGVLVFTPAWIGWSLWSIRAYGRWSRGVRPSPVRRPTLESREPGDLELPPELLPPRALPIWARPKRWATALAAAVLLLVDLWALLARLPWIALVLTVAGLAVAAPVLAYRRARRRLLIHGTPAVGTVSELVHSRGRLAISFDFRTPAGRRTGTSTVDAAEVVRRYGGWPELGERVHVVYDSGAFPASALWSLPDRRPRPSLPPGVRARQVALWIVAVILFVAVYATFRTSR